VLRVASLFGGSAFEVVVSVDLALVLVMDVLVYGGVRFVAEFVGGDGCSWVEEVVGVSAQFVSCLSFSVGVMFGVGALVVLGL
jgi:prolipoprotein diacylglyceryltransferase